ncbi:hypothetical protein DFP73DRAFT_15124 [Morchella snyderi]|nr:hypothetical protein DFP73DRAFT_15124 [Morchella snyderi]
MVSRKYTFIALIVAAAFSPLSAVLAQTTTATVAGPTPTNSLQTSATVTSIESSATPTASYSESASTSVAASQTDGLGYYPTVPGQSYDDPNKLIDETADDSTAGADGSSDTFINIPLGAQIGIISVVVIAGIGGLVASYLWYMRRRKQWELQGRRRSLVPRFSVNARGELKMSRPIITRQPAVPPTPNAVRSSTNSVAGFLSVDLEKGANQGRDEFEVESKTNGGSRWKKMISRK